MSDSDVSDEVESSGTQLKMFGFGHEPNLSGKNKAAQAVASIWAVFLFFVLFFFILFYWEHSPRKRHVETNTRQDTGDVGMTCRCTGSNSTDQESRR